MKLCCIFNYNPHYRLPIFTAIDNEFNPDFYFGKLKDEGIKEFDPTLLNGFKERLETKNSFIKGFQIYKGLSHVLCKDYTHYLITGESGNISNWIILLYARLSGKKAIIWSHGLYSEPKGKFRLFSKCFFALPDHILLYNRFNSRYVAGLGQHIKDKINFIYNSLDTDKQSEIYIKLTLTNIYKDHFKNDYPTFIYIGRIQKRKKIDLLIKASEILTEQGCPNNVVIVGGQGKEPLSDCIGNISLNSNIWYYGPSYDETKIAELIYNACACVSPGNVGLTAIHSLSYGTPVITHDNFNEQMPEFESIMDGQTGSFFSQNNVYSLVDKMMLWAKIDIVNKEKVRNLARRTVLNNWSVKYQLNVLKTIIQ